MKIPHLSERIRRYGIRRLARALQTNPSTVKRWADAGRAPPWRMAELHAAFRKRSIANLKSGR